jgi:hypothetical protein
VYAAGNTGVSLALKKKDMPLQTEIINCVAGKFTSRVDARAVYTNI